ncbi:hypothetical protein [Limnohabitans sp. Rim8]|uniref:glycosyltransferase family protein n=1 Tax=Limnohabitans sp. Rim8 TaxID=1100718 RepID=UPI0025F4374C|nr:hypothetical protein [Limnohabitans sp. Rim8]
MARLLKKIGFHANGKPRTWLKSLVFDAQLAPRSLFKPWIWPHAGDIHPAFRAWLLQALQNPAPSPTNDWPLRRQRILDQKSLGSARTLVIVCTRATTFVAHALQTHAHAMGFAVRTEYDMPDDFPEDVYLVICPQMFSHLPPREKRIVFQMEQSVHPRWFTPDYLKILYNSVAVFDYSAQNIQFLIQQGLPADMLFHVPLSPVPHYPGAEFSSGVTDSGSARTCDVLFYGDLKNKRRQAFLKVLSEHFDVRAERSLYGKDLWRAMAHAKVVVNIHYYDNALLESTRICECLSLGARVVSEAATDQGQHADWEDLVVFTPIDDVQAMVQAIHRCLQQTPLTSPSLSDRAFRLGPAFENAFRTLNLPVHR